jgi:hypothetical protein
LHQALLASSSSSSPALPRCLALEKMLALPNLSANHDRQLHVSWSSPSPRVPSMYIQHTHTHTHIYLSICIVWSTYRIRSTGANHDARIYIVQHPPDFYPEKKASIGFPYVPIHTWHHGMYRYRLLKRLH